MIKIMKANIGLICLIISLPALLPAGETVIGEIRIEGAGHLPERDVLRIVGLDSGQRLQLDSLDCGLERLLDRYRADGYLHSQVEAGRIGGRDGGIDLRITIDEGSPVRLGRVAVAGDPAQPPERLLELADLSPGEPLDSQKFWGAIENVREFYLHGGHSAVRVEPADFSLGPAGELDFALKIEAGPKFSIGEIRLLGVEHAGRGLIRKVAGLQPGATFSLRRLKQARTRLLRSGYFDGVEILGTEARAAEGLMDVSLRLDEAPLGSFGGLVGYQPPEEDGGGGGLMGQIDLKLNNLTGAGRFGSIYWQRLPGSSSILQLELGDPYLFGSNVGLDGGLHQLVEDSLYIRRDLLLRSQFFRWGSDGLLLAARTSRTWPDAGSAVEGSDTRNAGVGLVLDRRDRALDAGRGIYLYLLNEIGRSRIDGKSGRSGRLTADMEAYRPLGRRRTLFAGLHLRRSLFQGDKTPTGERFLLGGNRTLRGFRENEFRAWEAVWVNLEGRFKLSDKAGWVPFIDIGRVNPETAGRAVKLGYGLGLRLKLASGALGIDYALSPGRALGGGLVHLRISEEF